jgi:hypothetical protein
MSLSSELIFGCVHMFAAMFGAEQHASLHQCKDAPCSGATQGTDVLLIFMKIFKKNPTILSRPIAWVKGF